MAKEEPMVTEMEDGSRHITLAGELHSVDDEPAYVYADGTRWWYRQGKIHRSGAPAVVWRNGVEEWWRDGQRHRDDGPALIYPDAPDIVPDLRGVRQYWQTGVLMREELPPSVAAYRREKAALQQGFRFNRSI